MGVWSMEGLFMRYPNASMRIFLASLFCRCFKDGSHAGKLLNRDRMQLHTSFGALGVCLRVENFDYRKFISKS